MESGLSAAPEACAGETGSACNRSPAFLQTHTQIGRVDPSLQETKWVLREHARAQSECICRGRGQWRKRKPMARQPLHTGGQVRMEADAPLSCDSTMAKQLHVPLVCAQHKDTLTPKATRTPANCKGDGLGPCVFLTPKSHSARRPGGRRQRGRRSTRYARRRATLSKLSFKVNCRFVSAGAQGTMTPKRKFGGNPSAIPLRASSGASMHSSLQ